VVSCRPLLAAEAPAPRFSQHVAAVFSRLGCNSGCCHGMVKGQNGFRLSLFAGDLGADHERLLREYAGRRVNSADPDASLLLLKATDCDGGVEVTGVGDATLVVRFRADTAVAQVLVPRAATEAYPEIAAASGSTSTCMPSSAG
jgi:hypothetical protein